MTPPLGTTLPSIRLIMMMWFAPAVIVVGILSVYANVALKTASVEDQLVRHAEDVASELAGSLSEHVWNMDDDAIAKHFIDYPWGSLGLVAIMVTTEFGDVLYQKQYSDEKSPVSHRIKVTHEGRPIGFIEASLSTAGLTEIRRAIGNTGVMVVTAATLAILLLSHLIVSHVVAKPLGDTVEELRRIASGEYTHALPCASNSELQMINEEVSIMATEVSQRQKLLEDAVATREEARQKLRKLNEDLEDRIRQRTIQLRRLAQMLTAAQDTEQRRIAEGLHDDVAQLLAAGRMKVALASTRAPDKACRDMMTEIDDLIKQAYESLRLLSFELASSTLYQWGLKESLERLCAGMNERFGVSFKITRADDLGEIDDTSATILFKSAREILFNVIKHSGVTRAEIMMEADAGHFKLIIEDKGKGFNPETDIGAGHGLGLFSIKERMEDIDGQMKVESEPGLTRVSLIVPRRVEDSDERGTS